MADIKYVHLFFKHNDNAIITLQDAAGYFPQEVEGYIPAVGILGGDTTELKIDNDTGKIIGWIPIYTLGEDI